VRAVALVEQRIARRLAKNVGYVTAQGGAVGVAQVPGRACLVGAVRAWIGPARGAARTAVRARHPVAVRGRGNGEHASKCATRHLMIVRFEPWPIRRRDLRARHLRVHCTANCTVAKCICPKLVFKMRSSAAN